MFDKNTSLQYPLISEIDAYSVDTFCTAETLGCVYSIYTADILAVLNPSKTSLKFAVLYDQSILYHHICPIHWPTWRQNMNPV